MRERRANDALTGFRAAGISALIFALSIVGGSRIAAAEVAQTVTQSTTKSQTVTKDLVKDYGGVSADTLNRAIDDARKHFTTQPNDTYVITIPAGTFQVDKTIYVSNLSSAQATGRLIIRGAGKDQTVLVTNPDVVGIRGTDTYHVSFIGIHFTLPNYTVTQGHVVSVAQGEVVLDIQKGFPTPAALMSKQWLDCHNQNPADSIDACGPRRRYLKKYEDSRTDPHIVENDNQQISWYLASPVQGTEGRWKIQLARSKRIPSYAPGDFIGIKSKKANTTYRLCRGSDFVFEDIRWTQRSRGVFRCGYNYIRISGTEILRAPAINGQVPVMSSPSGGPQIGHGDEATNHNIVENNLFVATGDDSIGVFSNDATTIIRNNRIYDSFARGILLRNSPNVQLSNNTVMRSRVLRR